MGPPRSDGKERIYSKGGEAQRRGYEFFSNTENRVQAHSVTGWKGEVSLIEWGDDSFLRRIIR